MIYNAKQIVAMANGNHATSFIHYHLLDELMLSGSAPPCLAPWVHGVKLTGLLKKVKVCAQW